MSYLRSRAVDKFARKFEVDVARQLNYLVGFLPDFGFVFVHPVEFGFLSYVAVGVIHLRKVQNGLDGRRYGFVYAGTFTFVQPYEERTENVVVFVDESDGIADCGNAHGDNTVKAERIFVFDVGNGFDEAVPVSFGVLFRPAAVE